MKELPTVEMIMSSPSDRTSWPVREFDSKAGATEGLFVPLADT
jgi:hypothetical protein